jgi:hypothetical protein
MDAEHTMASEQLLRELAVSVNDSYSHLPWHTMMTLEF